MQVSFYSTESGRQPALKWVNDLDAKIQKRVTDEIAALEQHDFTSDHRLPKNVVHLRHASRDQDFKGIDVYELRVNEKRVYFSKSDDQLVVVAGGSTDTATQDVIQAFTRAKAHEEAKQEQAQGAVIGRR